jgi:hypothetical protein
MPVEDVSLPEFRGKWRSPLTENRYFFYGGIPPDGNSFSRGIMLLWKLIGFTFQDE